MELTDEQKARLFDALHADGVDNWQGYGETHYQETMAEIEAENDLKENMDRLDPLFLMIEESMEVDYPAGREAGPKTSLTEDGMREIAMFIFKNFSPKTS